ncbi:hypothetical protein, partial [Salmonella enterica]|uniref:hypothetical protein n=1 Tax=Salmonella enterica TaxID=28901 RepID=UPI003D2E5866
NGETLWYVATTSPYTFGSTLYAQQFVMSGINSLNTSMKPQLFEALIACDSTFVLYDAQPKLRIHSDSLGNVGSALTGWIDCGISSVNPITLSG